eukprot:266871-Prorocentrum_minimum.AAC.1
MSTAVVDIGSGQRIQGFTCPQRVWISARVKGYKDPHVHSGCGFRLESKDTRVHMSTAVVDIGSSQRIQGTMLHRCGGCAEGVRRGFIGQVKTPVRPSFVNL